MSIRLRLLVTTALIVVVALVVADVATYTDLRSYVYTQADSTLALSHAPIESSLSGGHTPDSESDSESGDGRAGHPGADGGESASHGMQDVCGKFHGLDVDIGGLAPGTVIEVRTTAGKVRWTCTVTQLGTTRAHLPTLPSHVTGFRTYSTDPDDPAVYLTVASRSRTTSFRVRVSFLRKGPAAGKQLVVAVPLGGAIRLLSDLAHLELLVSGVALVLALLLGWLLVRANLRSLRSVEHTAEAIAHGQLDERVPGDEARTEVGRVARALNYMLGRIQDAFAQRDRTESALRASEERMRRFIADASHELRTPLAAVRAYAELFDRGAAQRPEDLGRLIEGIQLESGRMGHLVEDLLLLAYLDEGRPLQLAPADLVAVAGEAVTTANTVGPAWPARLVAARPVEATIDVLRFRQVLDNLIGNVRVHCPAGTAITVRVDDDATGAVVTVSDDGPGMDDENLARAFQRFHRANPSRSRKDGGSGLGLAIVDAIVRAHGGTVRASRAAEGGLQFTVQIPHGDAGSPPRDDAAMGV
ncbi:MAG: sensor histidine kinase [Acidimicrobiales bacterium]